MRAREPADDEGSQKMKSSAVFKEENLHNFPGRNTELLLFMELEKRSNHGRAMPVTKRWEIELTSADEASAACGQPQHAYICLARS